jgi:hypothetical protein
VPIGVGSVPRVIPRRLKGGHDEGGSEHVRVYQAEPGPLADGADPSMSGTSVEALPVPAAQYDGGY